MMSPVYEMEQIIKEIAVYDKIDFTKSYTIKSFPEMHIIKYTYHYMVEIMKAWRQSDDVIKRYEEFRNELGIRKITIENEILDNGRKILFRGNSLSTSVPIYYKDCVFTSHYGGIGEYCENCIVEGGET